jgi:hypothetical protein
MSKYLEFSLIEEKSIGLGQKIKIIGVWSKKHSKKRLGLIKWFGRWRQYTFFPETGTVFNAECLNDIVSHIKGLR